jgi:class 3 adenylate cyclase
MNHYQPDPRLTAPHVSCRMLTGFLEYFEELEGAEFVSAVVSAAGLPMGYVRTPERWVSREYVDQFVLEVVQRMGVREGDPDHFHPIWQHWREVGRRALRPHLIGPIHAVLRALGAPGPFYRQVPKLISKANHVLHARLVECVPGMAEIEITPLDSEAPDTPWACWNRLGLFEGAPEIWGLPHARVEHHECIHHPTHPSEKCVYRIHFRERSTEIWLPTMGFAGLGALIASGLAALFGAPILWPTLTGTAAGIAMDGWRRSRLATRTMQQDGQRMAAVFNDTDQRYAALWEERQALRRALHTNQKFSGYLNRRLVEQILEKPDQELRLGGRRTHAAVLFGDIVGFTRRCERLTPEAVVEDLNTWFSHVDPIIKAYGGIIDKRIGDAVMVVFVPREGEDRSHQEVWSRAVRCGLAMQAAMPECRSALARRRAEPMALRVGIAAGSLVQGTMGSPERYEYTVIGDVVNVASRLENRATPGHVLVQSELLEGLELGRVVDQRIIQVKGRDGAIEVTELAPESWEPPHSEA